MNEIGLHEDDWDKHFKLMADIDLSSYTGTEFNIIGSYSPWRPFTGIFDGNAHTISNFTYTSTDTDYIGLFGRVAGSAQIKDLGLIDPNVDAGTGVYVGSLVGNLSGSITSCYAKRGSVSGNYLVGGLIGAIGGLGDMVINCYATCSVSGNEIIGGLVGFNNANIFRCYSAGSVTGNKIVGGLVGENTAGYFGAATIFNCYSTASVSGNHCVGGLVGANPQSAVISKCYSYGRVSGTAYVGGLVGSNDNWAPDSFWDIQTSGQTTSDGGTGKTTAEMHTESTFTDAGWDFLAETTNGTEDIWWILEGQDYPRLWWELTEANFIVVDDFESYHDLDPTDPESNRIWYRWIDGYGIPTNGSIVGFCDEFCWMCKQCHPKPVHGGAQSLDLSYSNTGGALYSEATCIFSHVQDWTEKGVGVLSLWFYGDPNNAPEPMYVGIANANGPTEAVYHDNLDAPLINEWTEWRIDLQGFAAQSVDLTNVETLSIGFGDKNNPQAGGSGLVFFDDIRLYRLAPEPEP